MSDKENKNPHTDAVAENHETPPARENISPETEVATDAKPAEASQAPEYEPKGGAAPAGAETGDSGPENEPGTDGADFQEARAGDMAPIKKPSRKAAEPEFEDEQDELSPTRCAKVFNGFAHIGPLILIIAVGLMVWPDFWQAFKGAGYYCPAEVGPITSAMRSMDHNVWLTPAALAGGSWTAQWPAYTWLLGLLNLLTDIPGIPADIIYPLAASLCACVGALAVWGLAHAARFGSQAALASGIILLCAPLFAPLPHFVGQSVLSATLMILSLAFFCRGWIHDRAWISLPIAFILCGLAGLSGGIFYLGVPLLASICFLIWRGSLRRGQGKDALFGFALLLILLGCWVSAVILLGSEGNYLTDLFKSGLRFEWPMQPLWWLVFVIAAAGALPWLLTIFGVSWVRVIARAPASFSASRHDNGSALVWISLTIACLATPFFSHRPGIAIALLCLAAPLLGKAFMRMPPLGNKFFFLLASLLAILAGLLMLCASFSFSQGWLLSICPQTLPAWIAPALLSLDALPILGGIVLLAGIIAIFVFTRRDHEGGGLVFSLVTTIVLCQPAALMLAPQLAANPSASLLTLADIQGIYKQAGPNQAIPPAVTPAPMPSKAPIIYPAPASEPNEPAPAPATPEAVSPATRPEATPDDSLPAIPPPATSDETTPMEPQAPAPAAEPTAPAAQPEASGADAGSSADTPAPNGATQEQQTAPDNEASPVQAVPDSPETQGEAAPGQKPEVIIEEVIVEKPEAGGEAPAAKQEDAMGN